MVEDFQSVKSSGMGHFLHWGVEYLDPLTKMGDRGITDGGPPTSDPPLVLGRRELKSDGVGFGALIVPIF